MEFVVGQWVECVTPYEGMVDPGKAYLVDAVHSDGVVALCDVSGLWDKERFKPFVWQVGKTYRTTLDGAFGKILSTDEKGDIYGNVMGQPLILSNYWHAETGKDFNEQRGADLLPYLADEPCDPGPTLAERYTVGQLGTLWGVFDQQSMMFARFSGKEVAEDAIRYIDEVYDELAWWRIENSDMPEADTQSPVAQPDPINPQHYRDHPSGIECIQVAEHMSYCLGNAIKYLWRAGKKGDAVEDLKKAAWYVNREIERLAKGGAE